MAQKAVVKKQDPRGIASAPRPVGYLSPIMQRVEKGELRVTVKVNSFGFATRTFHKA